MAEDGGRQKDLSNLSCGEPDLAPLEQKLDAQCKGFYTGEYNRWKLQANSSGRMVEQSGRARYNSIWTQSTFDNNRQATTIRCFRYAL